MKCDDDVIDFIQTQYISVNVNDLHMNANILLYTRVTFYTISILEWIFLHGHLLWNAQDQTKMYFNF